MLGRFSWLRCSESNLESGRATPLLMASDWSEVCRLILGWEQAWRLSTNVPNTSTESATNATGILPWWCPLTRSLHFKPNWRVVMPEQCAIENISACKVVRQKVGRVGSETPHNIGGDILQWSS